MSERTARTWQRGALPSTAKAPRTWRTREDPFADVWQSEVVPQLVADTDGRLQVLTLSTHRGALHVVIENSPPWVNSTTSRSRQRGLDHTGLQLVLQPVGFAPNADRRRVM